MKQTGAKLWLRKLLRMNSLLLSVVSLLLAVFISGIIMALCGYNPFEAFGAILEGAFGGQRAMMQTLTQATPLIFTGLAFTVAKKLPSSTLVLRDSFTWVRWRPLPLAFYILACP